MKRRYVSIEGDVRDRAGGDAALDGANGDVTVDLGGISGTPKGAASDLVEWGGVRDWAGGDAVLDGVNGGVAFDCRQSLHTCSHEFRARRDHRWGRAGREEATRGTLSGTEARGFKPGR